MNQISFPSNLSYWEIEQYLQDINLLVVGSGIVGLTTAIFYKKRHPEKRVIIIEKGLLPSGASTKNAGFACFGSPSEILADLNHSSEEEVYAIIKSRLEGLSELRMLVGDSNLSFNPCGGFEVFRPEDEMLYELCMEFLPRLNSELSGRLNLDVAFENMDGQIDGLQLSNVEHLIKNNYEGAIDTGKMMGSLIKLAHDLDIIILNGMEVKSLSNGNSKVEIALFNGWNFNATKVHIATNGFANKLLPELEIKPARAQVLITSKVDNLKLNGTFHLEEGFYYFRNIDNRILLGGGRNLDLSTETTTKIEITEKIQSKLDEILSSIILPHTDYTIEHRWAGIMGIGAVKKPIIKHISELVTCSVRLGGMGIAIGTSIGKESAELIG
jgi:hypothetical protein